MTTSTCNCNSKSGWVLTITPLTTASPVNVVRSIAILKIEKLTDPLLWQFHLYISRGRRRIFGKHSFSVYSIGKLFARLSCHFIPLFWRKSALVASNIRTQSYSASPFLGQINMETGGGDQEALHMWIYVVTSSSHYTAFKHIISRAISDLPRVPRCT